MKKLKIIPSEELKGADFIEDAAMEITETLLYKFPDHASAPGVHVTIILNVLNQAFANIILLVENDERKQLVKLFNAALIRQLDVYDMEDKEDADSRN